MGKATGLPQLEKAWLWPDMGEVAIVNELLKERGHVWPKPHQNVSSWVHLHQYLSGSCDWMIQHGIQSQE